MTQRPPHAPLLYERASALDEIPLGGLVRCRAGSTPVVLFRFADGVYALRDRCPHEGSPLSEGQLCDATIVCPSHGWAFDARTGAARSAIGTPARAYRTCVRDGTVFVAASPWQTLWRRLRARWARDRGGA